MAGSGSRSGKGMGGSPIREGKLSRVITQLIKGAGGRVSGQVCLLVGTTLCARKFDCTGKSLRVVMSTSARPADGEAGHGDSVDGARGKWSSVIIRPGCKTRPIGDLCPRFIRRRHFVGKATCPSRSVRYTARYTHATASKHSSVRGPPRRGQQGSSLSERPTPDSQTRCGSRVQTSI